MFVNHRGQSSRPSGSHPLLRRRRPRPEALSGEPCRCAPTFRWSCSKHSASRPIGRRRPPPTCWPARRPPSRSADRNATAAPRVPASTEMWLIWPTQRGHAAAVARWCRARDRTAYRRRQRPADCPRRRSPPSPSCRWSGIATPVYYDFAAEPPAARESTSVRLSATRAPGKAGAVRPARRRRYFDAGRVTPQAFVDPAGVEVVHAARLQQPPTRCQARPTRWRRRLRRRLPPAQVATANGVEGPLTSCCATRRVGWV